MRIRFDYRIVILLLLAIAFWFSAMQNKLHFPPEKIVIREDFIDFDYDNVFNVTSEEGCLVEPSALGPSPAL